LPAQGLPGHRSSPAGTGGGYSLVGSTLCSEIRPTYEETHRDDSGGGYASAPSLSLAPQRAGAGELYSVSGDSYSRAGSRGVPRRTEADAESYHTVWDHDS